MASLPAVLAALLPLLVAAQRNPYTDPLANTVFMHCWDNKFQYETCCDPRWGDEGNPECWTTGGFSYEVCCTPLALRQLNAPLPQYLARHEFDAMLDPPSLLTAEKVTSCFTHVMRTGEFLDGTPCKELMFHYLKEVATPPPRLQLVGVHHPLLLRTHPFYNSLTPLYDFYHKSRVLPGLYWGGDEQRVVEKGLMMLLRPGDVVVDGGANVGALMQIFAISVGTRGRVHAFEPMRLPFQLLNANAALGGFDNVWTYNKALGNETTTTYVHEPTLRQPGSFSLYTSLLAGMEGSNDPSFLKDAKDTHKLQKVEVVRIDDLGLDRLDFLKLDTEGYEWRVVQGAAETLRRHRPVVFAEVKPDHQGREFFDFFRQELGYRCYNALTSMVSEYICTPPHRTVESDPNVAAVVGLWTSPELMAAECRNCRREPAPFNY